MPVTAGQREHWRARMAAFRASGCSAEAWARAEGVTPQQMGYWRRQFLAEDVPCAPALAPFAAVTVRGDAGTTDAPALVVEVGGARIAVRSGFEPSLLRAVVQALAGVPC